jgi:uncharacterized protein YceK
MKKIIGVLVVIAFLSGCTTQVNYLKEHGPKFLQSMGFEVIAYEGYQWGMFGGKVWYQIRDPKNPNVRYSVWLIHRGGEIHFYMPTDENFGQAISINKGGE